MITNRSIAAGVVLGVLVPLGVLGANLTIPHRFTAGTPIRSAEVNANFTAIETATNAKLDVSAAMLSGTRFQIRGYRGADGTQLPDLVVDNAGHAQIQLYDRQLGLPCLVQAVSDHTMRCVPTWYPNKVYFADAQCTYDAANLLYPNPPAPGGGQTTRYLGDVAYFSDQTPYRAVYALTPYMGAVYELQDQLFCVPIAVAVGTQLFKRGALAPLSTFAELQPVSF